MFFLSIHFFVFIFSFVLLLFGDNNLNVVILVLFFAGIELYLWEKREKQAGTINWCHPIPVFVLGYCIVYYQLPFCYFAGFDLSYYSNYVIFSPKNISYCVLLGSSGLAAFFCGEQVIYLKNYKIKLSEKRNLQIFSGQINNYFTRIKNTNTIVLLLTIIFFGLYIKSIGITSYIGFTYGNQSIATGGFSTHFGFAFTIFLYLAILLEITRLVKIRPNSFLTYCRSWDKRVLAVTAITLVPFILSGDRGSYLQPLSLIFAPYFLLVKPLRFPQAMMFMIVGAFILVLVGDTRGGRSVTWTEAVNSRIASVSNPAEWPTMELANSFGTFNIATFYFPEKYPYNSGVNTFYRITSLIPFSSFFTEIDKKNKENDYIYSSSLFFTNILTQGTFSSGSGTSSLADIYMDFGPYGIPPVLFLWGIFMGWISRRAVTTFSSIFVFLFSYYSYFGIYVNRSSFFFGWNNFIWVILLYLLINRFYILRRLQG